MSLPISVVTSDTPQFDYRRNRVAASLANFALRLATEDYRLFIRGSIEYGMAAAARDISNPTTT